MVSKRYEDALIGLCGHTPSLMLVSEEMVKNSVECTDEDFEKIIKLPISNDSKIIFALKCGYRQGKIGKW